MARISKKRLKELEILETKDTKICLKCKQIKSLHKFAFHKTGRKFADNWCTSCVAEKQRKRRYDMTLDDYEKLLKQQDGKCAICGISVPGGRGLFHIDHNHKIKNRNKKDTVRGLLCMNCNHGLGKFKDNPKFLIAAANYLLK